MFPPYSSLTSPIPYGPSPQFSPTGQAHQNIPQPTQQHNTTMSPPFYSLTTTSMTGIGQAHQTIQQQNRQYYTVSRSPLPTVNMTSHSTPQSSMISSDDELTVSRYPDHHHHSMSSLQSRSRPGQNCFPGSSTPPSSMISPDDELTVSGYSDHHYHSMSSLQSHRPGQNGFPGSSTPPSSMISPDGGLTVSGCSDHHHHSMSSLQSRSNPGQNGFPGSSTSANLGDRSVAPPSRMHIVNSPNGTTATRPFGFAADPSSHVANMSIEAAVNASGVSNGSEAASAHSFSTYKIHTRLDDAMIDNTARPKFATAESIPLAQNGAIPMVPKNVSGPQNTYTFPPTNNMNQYTGYTAHNPPSLHSSQYRNTVTEGNIPPSSSLQMARLPQYVSPNTDLAPHSSYPTFAHDFESQRGSQPACPLYQPAPRTAPSPSILLQQDLPPRSTHSRPSSGRRKTRAQDTYPSPSTIFSCEWHDENDTLCAFQGSLDNLKKHFTSSHLSGAQNALGKCQWQGCLYQKRANSNVHDMRRDSTWRHVRERHLKIKRGT